MSLIRPVVAMAMTLLGAVFDATQAGTLMVSGNDAKAAQLGGGYKVDANPPPDTLVVLDAKTLPVKILGQVNVHHSVSAPPSAVALAPDEHLALLAAPNRVDPADPTKLIAESFLQVITIKDGNPVMAKEIALPHQPIAVVIDRRGTQAFTVQREGELSLFRIAHGEVALQTTITIGDANSKTSDIALTPDGRWALVAYRGENAIGVFSLQGGTPALQYKIPVGKNPYGVHVAPDGAFAVIANVRQEGRPANDTINLIDLTHAPFKVVQQIDVAPNPEGLAISPDSKWVAVGSINGANRTQDNPDYHDYGLVTVFRAGTDALMAAGGAHTGHNTQGVIFTPDSRHLLVQDYMEKSLSAFALDEKGMLTRNEALTMPGRPASIAAAP
jgi:DNA-binding beta-propeller fold protein YncE